MTTVFRLACCNQQYSWGKIGSKSKVAQYAQAIPDFVMDQSVPYAELWMGTHLSGPSLVVTSSGSQPLSELIKVRPELLDQSGRLNDLPFLFKVLSIDTALSIQAHPDKVLAEKIHREWPNIYKDPNHKPELAIALTPFEVLCGFRPVVEITAFLNSVPEFRNVLVEVGEDFMMALEAASSTDLLKYLKRLFTTLMTAPEPIIQKQLGLLVERISNSIKGSLEDLVFRLNSQFPGDVGCFCVYFLNYIQLKPGQAIFIPANTPHAYLSGDCIECMATSDNVIRAGLTTKYRDVNLLIEMLNYEYSLDLLVPTALDSTKLLYHAPVSEFDVIRIQLESHQSGQLDSIQGPSIVIVTEGNGEIMFKIESNQLNREMIQSGYVYFIGASTEIEILAGEVGIVVFRAFCDLGGNYLF